MYVTNFIVGVLKLLKIVWVGKIDEYDSVEWRFAVVRNTWNIRNLIAKTFLIEQRYLVCSICLMCASHLSPCWNEFLVEVDVFFIVKRSRSTFFLRLSGLLFWYYQYVQIHSKSKMFNKRLSYNPKFHQIIWSYKLLSSAKSATSNKGQQAWI